MEHASQSAEPNDLGTAEVDKLLVAITRDGFTLRYCNGAQQPTMIVGTYDWGSWADIVVIRGIDDVISARIPITADTDMFAPHTMVWAYEGKAQHALRALLDLAHPDHPQAPTAPVPAPPALHVRAALEAPITIRSPTAATASTRQIRLTAALPTDTAESQTESGVSR